MRGETRRQDQDRKSFYCRAWESRVAGEIQTRNCRGGRVGLGEKGSKAGGFKMAIDRGSGPDPHRHCFGQLSYLATTNAKNFRGRNSNSREKRCSASV